LELNTVGPLSVPSDINLKDGGGVNVRADLEKQIFANILIRKFFLILMCGVTPDIFPSGLNVPYMFVCVNVCVFIQLYMDIYLFIYMHFSLKLESLLCANTWTRLIWLGIGTGGGRL
jgi:hypothetical protein